MKKTYITPSMETIKIASQTQMLAGSTLGLGTTPTDPGSSDSREWDDWDED
jgi:hypothetical protein